MDWKSIAITALTNTSFLTLLLFLFRHLLSQALDRDLERHKASLQRQNDMALERLRVELQRVQFEHQTVFVRLHEKRASVIEELYRQLVGLEATTRAYANPFEFSTDPTKDDLRKDVRKRYNDFIDLFERSRIYLEQDLCSKIKEMNRSFRETVNKADNGIGVNGISKKDTKKWAEAWRQTLGEIPALRQDIEQAFRELLKGA